MENDIAENAGEIVTAIVSDTTEAIETALENAEARAEAAEAIAEQIIEAAVHSEEQRLQDDFRREIFTWQENQSSRLSTLEMTLETMASELTNLSQSLLILQVSAETTPEPEIVEIPTPETTEPESAEEDDHAEPEAQPENQEAPRKRRRIFL